MRLDQFISQTTAFSRKDAKQLIRNRRIQVNGQVHTNANAQVSETDIICMDGNTVTWPGELYFMLNKPAGYCCSHDDDGAVSALKLLPVTVKKLHFAGRLDTDTTGLVLLSSDGQWCHRVTSPKQRSDRRKEKHYRVTLQKPLSAADIQQLENGLLLRNENEPTLPASITPIDHHCYDIAISEGRYHQVKRMFAAVGNHVQTLHRFRIANIMLDNTLAVGDFRPLATDEIAQFNHDS